MVIIRAKINIKSGKVENQFRTLWVNFRKLSNWTSDMRSKPHEAEAQLRNGSEACNMVVPMMRRCPLVIGVWRPQAWEGSWLNNRLGGELGLLGGQGPGRQTEQQSVGPPPANPLTVNCLGGQCRKQSSLPSAALRGDCWMDSDWGALTLSAGWHTPVFTPCTWRTWNPGSLWRMWTHSMVDLYLEMWTVLICLSSVCVADKNMCPP